MASIPSSRCARELSWVGSNSTMLISQLKTKKAVSARPIIGGRQLPSVPPWPSPSPNRHLVELSHHACAAGHRSRHAPPPNIFMGWWSTVLWAGAPLMHYLLLVCSQPRHPRQNRWDVLRSFISEKTRSHSKVSTGMSSAITTSRSTSSVGHATSYYLAQIACRLTCPDGHALLT